MSMYTDPGKATVGVPCIVKQVLDMFTRPRTPVPYASSSEMRNAIAAVLLGLITPIQFRKWGVGLAMSRAELIRVVASMARP